MPPRKKRKVESNNPTKETKQGKTKGIAPNSFKYDYIMRGMEWPIKNNASRKISAQSRNLGILNKSLGISGSLRVEQSQVSNFCDLKRC